MFICILGSRTQQVKTVDGGTENLFKSQHRKTDYESTKARQFGAQKLKKDQPATNI